MPISREYHYDSAHWLPSVPKAHKCGRMHGHTYRLTVTVDGTLTEQGWIMDFADIDKQVRPWLSRLDHRIINDEIENPTVEIQLKWWWTRLSRSLPLTSLELYEGISNRGSYSGPNAS